MDEFLAAIRERFLIGDGPMGSVLLSRLGHRYQWVEEFNLNERDAVVGLHKEYIDAGSMLLATNTFSANRIRLRDSEALDRIKDINRLGVELAREAAGDRAWVAGKLGPTGRILQPLGDLGMEEASEAYLEQASILADAGADLLVVETMGDLAEARVAFDAMRNVSDLPTVVNFAFDAALRTFMGVTPGQAAAAALGWGADVVGSNCGIGPDEVEQSIVKMMEVDSEALYWAQPNAGIPQLVYGQVVYGIDPERFAEYAYNMANQGVKVIASCCGSTPDHIRAMAERLEDGS